MMLALVTGDSKTDRTVPSTTLEIAGSNDHQPKKWEKKTLCVHSF